MTSIVKNEPLSASSIRRILLDLKLKSYMSEKKPLLTPSMAKKRLAWCRKYKDKDQAFWQKVIFSDETVICIRSNALMQRCRRFPWDSPYNPKFIRSTVKHPLSVMVWQLLLEERVWHRPATGARSSCVNTPGPKAEREWPVTRPWPSLQSA